MNRISKWIIILTIFIFYILPILIEYFPINFEEGNGFNDYARITNLDYKAVLVDEPSISGSVIITERITFDIHAASKNNLFWELWRDLPEDYVDGLKIDYTVNYVKQINDDGSETYYEESPKLYWYDSDYTSPIYGPGKWYHSAGPYNEALDRYECVFFYINGIYRDKITFEIQYVMHNAALKYSDVSELYLTMYSESSIKYLESFSGEILIPQKDMPQKGNYIAHTFGTNNHTFKYNESDSINPGYHTFYFNLNKNDLKFKNYNQYLEFTFLSFNEDKHIFTDYAPDNYYSNDVYLEEAKDALQEYDNLPKIAQRNKLLVLLGAILISSIIIGCIIYRDKKIKSNNKFYTSNINAIYYRDIPSNLDPYFAASLAFTKSKKKIDIGNIYSSLLLSLVRKKYIELNKKDSDKDWTNKNISIRILYKPTITINNVKSNDENKDSNYQNENNVINKPLTINDYLENQGTKPPFDTQLPIERYNIYNNLLESLTINEEALFNLITKYALGESISMDAFQDKIAKDYGNTTSFINTIDNSIVNIGISKGYLQKADYDGIKKKTNNLANIYILVGIIIILLGNFIITRTRLDFAYGALFILSIILFICAFLLKKVSRKYVLLTQIGEDEYVKWKGLYDFLNSQTLMKDKEVIDIKLWEKYLVYATAFGISEKVIKALKIKKIEFNDQTILNNQYCFSRSFKTSHRSFRNATRRASSISRSSSFNSSFYGGGGRGGGGGGGGH